MNCRHGVHSENICSFHVRMSSVAFFLKPAVSPASSFQESENTKIWGKSTKVQSKEEIIKLYQEKYKNIRADQFGF